MLVHNSVILKLLNVKYSKENYKLKQCCKTKHGVKNKKKSFFFSQFNLEKLSKN